MRALRATSRLRYRLMLAVVAGIAGNGHDLVTICILARFEIFFVDLACHFEHVTGDVFFRLGIAGEVQAMGSAIGGGCVAEVTFYAQRGFPVVHDLIQVFVADVFGQDLQVFVMGLFVCGSGGGHAYYHQDYERGCDHPFFTVQHKEVIFWTLYFDFPFEFRDLTVDKLLFLTIF